MRANGAVCALNNKRTYSCMEASKKPKILSQEPNFGWIFKKSRKMCADASKCLKFVIEMEVELVGKWQSPNSILQLRISRYFIIFMRRFHHPNNRLINCMKYLYLNFSSLFGFTTCIQPVTPTLARESVLLRGTRKVLQISNIEKSASYFLQNLILKYIVLCNNFIFKIGAKNLIYVSLVRFHSIFEKKFIQALYKPVLFLF